MFTRNNSSRSRAGKKVQRRESGDLEKILSLADFEIRHDPYRGMLNLDVASPWFECRYNDHVEESHGIVSQVVKCSCPSLINWTKELEALRNRKKRKRVDRLPRLGRRRDDPMFECPCDHNPFCLASLGGAMDDFLEEVATEILQQKYDDDERSKASSGVLQVSSVGVEIIDVDDNNINDAKHVRNDALQQASSMSISQSIPDEKMNEDEDSETNCDEGSWCSEKGIASAISRDSNTKVMVKLEMRDPSEVYLEDIHFSAADLDQNTDTSIYSHITKEHLETIRKEILVDLDGIRSYAENTILPHAGDSCTLDEYLVRLKALHSNMLFDHPLQENIPMRDKMRFAVPPGMKNLGATCYLNTQLQCLARNTAFLNGIFAWKASKSETRMDSVLSKLQQLLARLVHGVEATTTTAELSMALGLQNDEMQDPNEFARLLFERMQEAFQTSAIGTGNSTLSSLLPSLFEGTMTYETKCLCCGQVRERSEKFMDINLPIVRPDPTSTKGMNGQLRLEEAFTSKKGNDTSVQFCIDAYMQPEELTEENQYWCEACQQKQDASRQVVLKELPPVLNVQLCRYVYDRVKQAKKKLTDHVLLPHQLRVTGRQGTRPKLYRLCAVMNHLGNSAYRGHYIAEAMDWQTGIWFEFNDETVKVLGDGPKCSYHTVLSSTKAKGSQDAYNLYYVRESYLGKTAMSSIASKPVEAVDTVINDLVMERMSCYGMLSEMCLNDGKVSKRARRWRRGLIALLHNTFRSMSPTVTFCSGEQGDCVEDSVWVDGKVLRSLFGCTLEEPENMLCMLKKREDVLCEHGEGIHPAKARCGKIIPRKLISGLFILLQTDQVFSNTNRITATTSTLMSDCILLSSISCDQCTNEYKASLYEKVEQIRELRTLYDNLDPKAESDIEVREDDVYAVSKRFITPFRKLIATLLKKLESIDTISSGIDSLEDVLPLLEGSAEVDMFVNSTIVCSHGKCCSGRKRSIRCVSKCTWTLIRKYFPQAIALRKPKFIDWTLCKDCEGSTTERGLIEGWVAEVTSGLSLSLLEGRRKHEDVLPSTSVSAVFETYHIVHADDVANLREAWKLATNRDLELSLLKMDLKKLMFPHTQSDDNHDDDVATNLLNAWKPRTLICIPHELVLNPLVFSREIWTDDNVKAFAWRFRDTIALLPTGEYMHYVLVVLRLYLLLSSDVLQAEQHVEDNDMGPLVDKLLCLLASAFHPKVSRAIQKNAGSEDDAFTDTECAIGTAHINVRITPGLCADQQCNCDSIEDLVSTERLRALGTGVVGGKSKRKPTTSHNPIVIDDEVQIIDCESPLQDNANESILNVRLLDVEEKANLQVVMENLIKPDTQHDESAPRRSGRKRTQRFPVGPIKGDEMLKIHRDHNMASVRLHILEKDPSFKLDQPLVLFIPMKGKHRNSRESQEDSDEGKRRSTDTLLVEIPFEWNDRVITRVAADAIAAASLNTDFLITALNDMILIRLAPSAYFPEQKTAKCGRDEEAQNSLLMESLLGMANLIKTNEYDTKADTKKSNQRGVERGFTGTFLHSTLQSATEEDERQRSFEAAVDDLSDHHIEVEDPVVDTIGMVVDKVSNAFPTKSIQKPTTISLDQERTSTMKSNGNKNHERQHVLLAELVRIVSSTGQNVSEQESILMDAVAWAMDQNSPSAEISDLTDAAYAKYLEVTCL